MHFITGGSFHGKKSWAVSFTKEQGFTVGKVLRLFDEKEIKITTDEKDSFYMLEGLEWMIKNRLKEETLEQTIHYLEKQVETLLQWEREEKKRCVFIIGSDITKGIVPIEKEDRFWRDATGLIFQRIAAEADRVDVIWYGLNERLK
ncbi:bifunctional adenosylcobinamide kinase/adenosylcobinamide-phosphate guanylyltransferase [Niallia sp. Sow4_A1]|uniref:bifunctional adenosylcobinamide kinase/adenosylcobinamide-phosphate guanylyltransferase n=1 Tax=Bacillaceae TaxID=186817 RepID=UPI0025417639|nr:bifunctional adenosylcobinamide kinase/adenosylcobinamide-phosphate guanylyltransferase [Bacillus sp. T2.9-1]